MISKNTVITTLVILSLVLGFFTYNGIKVSSDRESALESELQHSNQRILEMRMILEKDSLYISQLNDSIKDINRIKDSLYLHNLKQDSIYENKIDSIVKLSTDSIANYIRSQITRRLFTNQDNERN